MRPLAHPALPALLALTAFPALLALAALPAAAQERGMPPSTCGEQEHVAGYLREEFREVPVSLGLQADGRMLQVFASQETGTWTMVSTTAGGTSCIVAVGEAWEMLPTGPIAEILGRSDPHPHG